MTIYNLLMTFGLIVVAAIIVRGFWSGNKVEPTEQPDNWQGNGN